MEGINLTSLTQLLSVITYAIENKSAKTNVEELMKLEAKVIAKLNEEL